LIQHRRAQRFQAAEEEAGSRRVCVGQSREKGRNKMGNSISFEEVSHVEVRCACGVGVVFPMTPDVRETKPVNCPACSMDLKDAVMAVKEFRQFYFHAKDFRESANGKVELRITDK
jgi:hypothetical protein